MIKKLFPLMVWIIISSMSTIHAQNVDLYLDTATVESGSDVTLELTADNFTDMMVLEFVLQWDSTVLEYVSHQDFNSRMGLEAPHFSTPEGIGRADVFKLAWNDPVGKDVPDGEVLFSLTFKAIGNNGTQSPVVFTIGPPPFRVWEIVQGGREYTEEEKENATHDGLVIVEDGGGGNASVDLIGSHETVEKGEEACVNVTVRGFERIKAMDAVMRYDDDVIKFNSIKNLDLPQLTQGNFTNPSPGQVRMSYNNPNGATVNDDARIFQVCFEAIGSKGSTSPFRFTGGDPNPPLEVVNLDDKALNVRPRNGSVTIDGGSGGDLYFEIEDKKINSSNICVPIKVSGFKNIVGYTHSIQFDPAYMAYDEDGESNFALDKVGLALNTNDVNQGKIGFLWSTADGEPKSLSDNTTLIELCFNLKDGCGSGTTVSFTDDPVVRGLYEAPDVEIFPEYRNGNLTCEGKSVSEKIKDASCQGVCDGEIGIVIKGWDISSIQWSDSSLPDSHNVTGLCAGTYEVTVTFTDNTTIVKKDLIVGYGPGPTVSEIEVYADLGNSDGAITLNTSGPDLIYQWSNGEETKDIDGLKAGAYSVTISDNVGCEAIINDIVVLSVNATTTGTTCSYSLDGSAAIEVSGGSGDYSYEWTCTGETRNAVTDLPGGDCTVFITDADSEYPNIVDLFIDAPAPIEISNVVISPDDGSGNGSIKITVTGGTEPYSFKWLPNGESTQNIDGLSDGSYLVVITDANGCEYTSEPIDLGEGGPIVAVLTSADENNGFGVSCVGDCNGYIEIQAYGLDDLAIVWDAGNTELKRIDLCPGEYQYTLTSSGDIVQENTILLKEPEEITIDKIDSECSSGNNGSVSIEVTGGATPYVYSWDNGETYDNEAYADGLSHGTHDLYIIDANGCEERVEYTVKECAADDGDCFKGRKVITPNGDGKNDELVIKYCGEIQSADIDIYTQWGELIYQEKDYQNDWEGKSNSGDILDDGLYHWVIRVVLNTGETQVHRGSVNLVRTMN